MNKSIVNLGLFFFLNLSIIQAANSSNPDVNYLRNLINQKQFSKLEKLKVGIESEVLTRWVNYESLLHAIDRNPATLSVEKKLHKFIKENPDHQFSEKLIESYLNKLDKVVRSSEHLKNKVMTLPNASLKDTLTSVTCLKNIGREIALERFQQLVIENEISIGCQRLIKEWLSKKEWDHDFILIGQDMPQIAET